MLNSRCGAPCVVFAIVSVFTWSLTTHGKYSASGDEPHYLMIAESLRTDGDLNILNNYQQNDGRLFGHDNLAMELHAIPSRTGVVRSVHGIGLPILLLPVYSIAQRLADSAPERFLARFRMDRGLFSYSVVSLFLIGLTSFGIALLAAGLQGITTPVLASTVAIAAGVSPPVVSHSFLIFPEVLALFVSCWVVWLASKRPALTDARMATFVVLALGALPWCHQKYFVYSLGLVIVLAWARRDLRTPLLSPLSIVLYAVPQTALLAWSWYEWGTAGGALTTGALTAETAPLTTASIEAGAVGLWFDRESGILAYAPLFWIVPACWILSWRRSWAYLVPAALLYLPAAAFVIGWWAGFSPAARYIAPAVPLFAVPVAYALGSLAIRSGAAVMLLMQLPIDLLVWQNPRSLWPAADGNRVLHALGAAGGAYERILAGVRADGLTRQALLPLSVAAILTAALVLAARRTRSE